MALKNITICAENNVDVNLDRLITYLNERCKSIRFNSAPFPITLEDKVITSPESYTKLDKKILEQCKNDFQTLIFTLKPYSNNYFWQPIDHYNIISFFNWKNLSKLSMNNGVAYFLAAILAQQIDISVRHYKNTGCIYDFLKDKTGIDNVMRYGHMCPNCLERIKTLRFDKEKEALIIDLTNILNDLSTASKWNEDLVDYWIRMKNSDIIDIETKGIEKAIELALMCKSEDERPRPKVGAVIIKNNVIVCEGYRGEENPGDHAEYTALIKKGKDIDFSGATLITTLEPCTTRKHGKKPCCQHIIDKGIKKVIIGMIDPNPEIRGKGEIFLQQSKKLIVDRFPAEYVNRVISINKDFWNSEMDKYNTDLMKIETPKEHLEKSKSNFNSFKEIFEYATSFDGMRLTHSEAKEFALKWMKEFGKKNFNSYKEMFEYATSFDGMRLTHSEAKEFALKWMESN